ncbi:MAG: sugar ABC transporter ATP-binding protein, partial [Planctomycetota bacterium]|jgi:ribose transport system ATP-binding protein|nr:sugar ABC transporter ATP-binding protein [Planctomycetota bacterium]
MYQEFNLLPEMTVAENMFLGREPRKGVFIDRAALRSASQEWLDKIGITAFGPDDRVRALSVAEGQFVSVAQAMSKGARLIVMDEPTASLTRRETETLFRLIRDLKGRGIAIIFISHHLDELFEIGDRITVLRDGEKVATHEAAGIDKNGLIRDMVGRELKDEFPARTPSRGDVILEAKNFSRAGVLNSVSFTLRKGEILGISGLVGAGRTELVRTVFGADPRDSGELLLHGRPVSFDNTPAGSIRLGIGLLPEERKRQGVLLSQSIRKNITLARLDKITQGGFLQDGKERGIADNLIAALGVKTPSAETPIKNLSGGNQQKAVIAKWLFTDADVLIFDEPTRGIDVGAKYDVYQLMNRLTEQGKSIIMVSSDMPEIIGMSDRVLVMHSGRITAEFDRADGPFDQERIMRAATGEAFAS